MAMMGDPDDYRFIDDTDAARDKHGWYYGGDMLRLSRAEIEKILAGQCLAVDINGQEYVLFLAMEKSHSGPVDKP